jgi:Xaa-Pro aminopeptidase
VVSRSGKIPSPDDIKAQYGVNQALYSNQLEEALFNMTQEANLTVYTTGAVVDQKSFLANYTVNTTVLSRAINSERPIKSSEEIVLLEIASNVSAAAHMKVMQSVKSGIYEYNVDALFVSLCYACDLAHQAYLPIVGAGEASATLHYIIKNSLLEEGQILLIDAGGQYKGYSSDITRTYPVNGVWTEDQILIYQTVLNIQTKGIELMQPGASFLQLRTDLNTYFAQQLLDAGLVQGSLESLVSASIWSYFMPHGYSHHVGLDVHDPGSLTILQPGYVLTMEPGIYFIEPLILPALDNSTVSPYLVKDKIMHFLDSKFGGVRIEDVVLITEEGNRVLSTGVPKSIDEIKRIMQGL